MSVRPSVRKTQERVQIIECSFFCLKGVYWESKLPNFDPNARRPKKLEPNEIFNDFAISREHLMTSIQTLFILKVWTRK